MAIIIFWQILYFFIYSNKEKSQVSPPNIKRDPVFDRFKKAEQNHKENKQWMKQNGNKFIIFLHFHKAGGTTLFLASTYVTTHFNLNSNANPKQIINGNNLTFIPFWEYNKTYMHSFIIDFKRLGVSFIAMENQYFHYAHSINNINFKKQYQISLITQLRHPYKRFLSNFFYEIKWEMYKENVSIWNPNIMQRLLSFHNGDGEYFDQITNCWSSWNLYIRILTLNCNNELKDEQINETHLLMAKRELDKFDTITIVDKLETFELLNIKYGIKINKLRIPSTLKYLKPYLMNEMENNALTQFEKIFMEMNKFDYMLYEYAVDLSLNMLKQYI
eukprot:51510_1